MKKLILFKAIYFKYHIMERNFPVLFGNAKTGKTKKWIISVKQLSNGTAEITTQNGYIDGKLAISTRLIESGKNIGKSNATTPFQQACNEAERKYQDKIEKEGYATSIENVETPIYPMLANKFDFSSKKKNDIVFPCFVQPKLDGLRCMSNLSSGNIIMKSRVGKEFKKMPHLITQLGRFFKIATDIGYPNIYADGELYSDELPFEEISGYVRVEKESNPENERKIQYHLYDLYIDPEMDYEMRKMILDQIFDKGKFTHLKKVETVICPAKQNVKFLHGEYVSKGFEGIMLRNKKGPYLLKNRSNDLQKYKEFEDEEFEIVGYKEANGEDRGTIIWECYYTKPDKSKEIFAVRPRGSREIRREWFEQAEQDFDNNFKGKLLTVRYQELGPEGCPRFPVGICVRQDID